MPTSPIPAMAEDQLLSQGLSDEDLASLAEMDTMDLIATESVSVLDLVRCVIIGIIGVVCIGGNALVLRTLIFFKFPKIPMYVAIGGLALSDILRALFQVPISVIEWTHHDYIATSAWCKASDYLKTSSMYIAACHLVGLSIIRCILLNDRAHSRSYVPHALVGCIIIWVVTLLTNIPSIMTQTMDENLKKCVEVSGLSENDEKNLWLRISFSYIVPVVVIIVVYFITYCMSKRYFEDSYTGGERRLSKMVSILIITWAICKFPFEILNIVVFYKSRIVDQLFFGDVGSGSGENAEAEFNNYLFLEKVEVNLECLSLVDLMIRPIIYAKLSHYFGRSFDEVINCTTCRKRRTTSRMTDSRCNIRHARISERVSESESQAQTPLNDIKMEDAEEDSDKASCCGADDITVLTTVTMHSG